MLELLYCLSSLTEVESERRFNYNKNYENIEKLR